jgi:3-hydroxyacyl-CoA dehydrogenase/enoyl-CoA hydratase/3-hydroxybutyryl-CoA epimerase/enoyl-CoA isomerase
MAQNKRFGQKNGIGFYRYEPDAAGKPIKKPADDTRALLASVQPNGTRDFSDQEIVDRLMLPMIIEAAHALEDGIVATPAELDTALVLGLGFPRYAGGPLKYADWLGLKRVIELADKYSGLGKQYEPSAKMREMAAQGLRYHT